MNEVIIDGCNVAECKYTNGLYNGVYGCINLNLNPACYKNPNCYFKQLKRAKAEKQDLINYYELREGGMLEDIQHWKNKAQEFYKELEQYKKSKQASYETLQTEWNYAINTLRDVEAENEMLKENLSEAEAIMLTYKIERDNYKQALEDIREIVSAEIDRTDADDELMQIYGSIYNKINEVINNAN